MTAASPSQSEHMRAMATASEASDREGDAHLLALYSSGDMEAAKILAARIVPRLHGMATRMLRDRAEAEDVVQETMLRLWRIAPDWDPARGRALTWTWRVAANLCTDRLRRRRRMTSLDAAADPVDPARPADARMQDDARATALHAALERLPERQRQAVAMRHLDELPNPQIAEIMELRVAAVESLIARGRRALVADLARRRAELGYDDDRG